jgi:4-hydroxy-3-polyprenylbenzoate decarboxylase
MAWRDFREFIDAVEQRGDLKVVEGADANLEIGTLTELMCERGGPMLLFDRIPGYAPGYRIAAKPYASTPRLALAIGLADAATPLDILRAWRDRVRDYKPVPPIEVRSGPVMENVQDGDEVDVEQFPAPKWHELDGGRYFGTGTSIITRDPDEGWVNVGCYRVMIHDRKTLGFQIAPYHHGAIHLRKWWLQGKACPMAIAISTNPYLFYTSHAGPQWGMSEFEYAGFLNGAPLEVITGPRTGLPLPADAEFVLEGEVPPMDVEQRTEGPFGEYTGYYAGGERDRPVLHIKAIYHRTNPILHGDPPLLPSAEKGELSIESLTLWEAMEKSGLPGIKGVYALNTGGGLTTVVCIKQQYAGHARQVGRVASGLKKSMCRVMIVVDDDIDPSNPEEVLWAVATRSDPETTWEIQRDCVSTWLDPMIRNEQKLRGALTSSRALIVACRPWEWMDEFPAVNKVSEELRRSTYEKWRSLFEARAKTPALV